MSEYLEKKFSQLDCGLELGKDLRNQIYEDLHADWVVNLMNENDFWEKSVPQRVKKIWRNRIKVTESVFRDLYDDLQEVKKTLHVDLPIDMYVVNNEEINAFSMMSYSQGQPSIILLHSGIVNILDHSQLLYIIGHEVGHLQNNDLQLNRIIDFFYGCAIPIELRTRERLIQKIQELRADRCGYIACENLESCISATFIMQSGVDYNRYGDNYKGFIEQCKKDLEIIKQDKTQLLKFDHPEDALRVIALQYFANVDEESELKNQTKELIDLLHNFSITKGEEENLKLYVSAGLMTASVDGKISAAEIDAIEMQFAQNFLFPSHIVAEFKEKDYKRIFNNCLRKLDKNVIHRESENLIRYMLKIVVSDQEITKQEFDFVHTIATDKLAMPEEQFAKIFASVLQNYYHPIYKLSEKFDDDEIPF